MPYVMEVAEVAIMKRYPGVPRIVKITVYGTASMSDESIKERARSQFQWNHGYWPYSEDVGEVDRIMRIFQDKEE